MNAYALTTLRIDMTPPPTDYQWLKYAPYLLIVIGVVAIWGPTRLTRNLQRPEEANNDIDLHTRF